MGSTVGGPPPPCRISAAGPEPASASRMGRSGWTSIVGVVATAEFDPLRDESLRATAQKILPLGSPSASPAVRAESTPLVLHFSPSAGSEELREVRTILRQHPGVRPVHLTFETPEGETLCVNAGASFCVSVSAELDDKLQPWLAPKREFEIRESAAA